MAVWVLGYLTGTLSVYFWHSLPSFLVFIPFIILLTIALFLFAKPYKTILSFLLAMLIAAMLVNYQAHKVLSWSLPKNLESKTIIIRGMISSLPEIEGQEAHFEFTINRLNAQRVASKIRLNWYQYTAQTPLKSGDEWQFSVRLKRAHGQLNPGSFDYETWLFSKKIRATGYIVNGPENQRLAGNIFTNSVNKVRQHILEKIKQAIAKENTAGLIIALVMGSQSGISADQWQVMRATGTNHLLAIAGVHIGFVAGFIYFLVNFIWRRQARWLLYLPAASTAACASLLMAIIYSALAGFSLPTQRALIMLTVAILGSFLRRELGVWNAYFLALGILLIWEPFIVLSTSFWLSFAAVAAILFANSGRIHPTGLWWKYGRLQWAISLGLVPLSLVLFAQTSLISLIANLFAVPAVGIFVLPLCLSGSLFVLFFPWLGGYLLLASAKIMTGIWWILSELAAIPGAVWMQAMPANWILITVVLAMLVMLAPRGFPGRWLGICCLLPLVFYKSPSPEQGEFWVNLLDVGQGLSALVQTKNHQLIFDTGPPIGEFDDNGRRVIIPLLNVFGIRKIDAMVISHGDSDHIGGANSLIKSVPISTIISSVPERFPKNLAQLCQQGQSWQWDGVSFTFLFPPPQLLHLNNNSSCVLKIGAASNAVLLTGDIEKLAENYLSKNLSQNLPAKVLVAPHHGSLTSSTLDFISAVKPNYVLFATGYKNRFHFPQKKIIQRYEKMGARMLNTATTGTISIHMQKNGRIEVQEYRKSHWHFWYDIDG